MRYKSALILKDGKRIVQNGSIEPPVPHLNDQYIHVTQNDRLDQIAHSHYGNKALWYIIAAANNIGKGTLYITKGRIIRVPINPMDTHNKLDDEGY